MGYIVKQPNGLYARFSTMIDDFTDFDMTRQDYVDLCVERVTETATRDANEIIDAIERHGTHRGETIEGAMESVMDHHGKKRHTKVSKLLGIR